MIGGIIGLGITFVFIFGGLAKLIEQATTNSAFLVLIVIFALALYILSFAAGFLLWKKSGKGFILSIIAQITQIFSFSIAGFSYLFVSGLQFGFVFGSELFKLLLYMGSTWNISFASKNSSFSIGINLIALFVLFYLLKQRQKKFTK